MKRVQSRPDRDVLSAHLLPEMRAQRKKSFIYAMALFAMLVAVAFSFIHAEAVRAYTHDAMMVGVSVGGAFVFASFAIYASRTAQLSVRIGKIEARLRQTKGS